ACALLGGAGVPRLRPAAGRGSGAARPAAGRDPGRVGPASGRRRARRWEGQMIRYDGFTKRFGRLTAVDALDLDVRAGETLALIGPNGSGKTTTLKAAIGLVRPTAGRIRVDGRDAADRHARARLGYLPQRLSFPEGCTAREALRLYARLRGVRDDAGRLLERVGLDGAADRPANAFSGGMRQRLGLAIALLGGPRALVL